MNPKILYIIFFVICGQLTAQDTIKYFFTGHCYQVDIPGYQIDERLKQLDFSSYEGVWLGGDLTTGTMLSYGSVQYIDSLFDLNNPETHWAMGNHDARNGNWEWYEEFTGRKTYYAYSSNNITRIVLNTNILPVNCEMLDDEFKIISDVCDTIQQSKYLILLMHHGLWHNIPDLPNPVTYAFSDLQYWNANCDSANTSFVEVVYPKLVEVKNKGIDVFCVMGDMGSNPKTFAQMSVDSIQFLGCGLDQGDPADQVIVFQYDVATQKMTWDFHYIDSLLYFQQIKK